MTRGFIVLDLIGEFNELWNRQETRKGDIYPKLSVHPIYVTRRHIDKPDILMILLIFFSFYPWLLFWNTNCKYKSKG